MKLKNLPRRVISLLLFLYWHLLSPLIHSITHLFFNPHSACRFTPTCSRYSQTAIQKYGIIRGGILSFKRLLRCHPFSSGGYDPVK